MTRIVICCLLAVVYSAIGHVVAGPVVPPAPIVVLDTGTSSNCVKFLADGKGDFRIGTKMYAARTADFFIQSVSLKERKSFYRCTPSNIKYGISADDKTWWVDKGCEAIFEITECPKRNTNREHRSLE